MRSLLEGGFLASFDAQFEAAGKLTAGDNNTLSVPTGPVAAIDTACALTVTGTTFACRYEIPSSLQNGIAAADYMMGVQWSTGTPVAFFSRMKSNASGVGDRAGYSFRRSAFVALSAGPAYVTDAPVTSTVLGMAQRMSSVIVFPSSLTVTLTPLMYNTGASAYGLYGRSFDVRVIA